MAAPEDKKFWEELAMKYTEPYGHPLLRVQIANLYSGLSDYNCYSAFP
jgi:hypothetical protein